MEEGSELSTNYMQITANGINVSTFGSYDLHVHVYEDQSSDGNSFDKHFNNPASGDIPHDYDDNEARYWIDFGNLTQT